MRIRPRSIALNLALLTSSVVLVLVLAELTLRAFPGLLPEEAQMRLHWAGLEGSVQTVGDPYVGFRYLPETTMSERQGELDWSFRTDAHGFRNAGPWPDTADVVVLGDSQGMGYGVSADEAWPTLVASGAGLDLVNLAIAGIGPEQERRIYETFGEDLHPAWVLFGVFPGNDFSDARMFQDWLDAGGPGSFAAWRTRAQAGPDRGLLGRLLERSYLAYVARLALRGAWTASKGITITVGDGSRLVLVPSFVESESRRSRPGHRDFELVMSAIEKAYADVTGAGARFVVVLFPTKEEVYMPPRGLDVPDLVGTVARALEQRGIPYLDLLPRFREAARAGTPLFFEVDGHPNASGNVVIARSVIDYLRSAGETATAP